MDQIINHRYLLESETSPDYESAEDCSDFAKTIDEWVEEFADSEYEFPSTPICYQMFKQIQEEDNKLERDILQRDFKFSLLMNSIVDYKINTPKDTIIHRGADNIKEEIDVKIPEYNSTYLNEIPNKEALEIYLQALFGTSNDLSEIIGTLKYISGKSEDKIILRTRDKLKCQWDEPATVILNYDNYGNFCIDCNYIPEDSACMARGIKIL